MERLFILGTSSGLEPMPGRIHSSFVLEVNGKNYVFDAGEGSSRRAHLSGIDLLNVPAIFLTHPHFDHTGGIFGWLWNIRKLSQRTHRTPPNGRLSVFFPNRASWEGIWQYMTQTEGHYKSSFELNGVCFEKGEIYRDENIAVSAFETTHLSPDGTGKCQSYGFSAKTASGKKILFSGDLKGLFDLDQVMGEAPDVLLCETGHHKVREVMEYAEAHGVGKLLLVHHNRGFVEGDPETVKEFSSCPIPYEVCYDGQVIPL